MNIISKPFMPGANYSLLLKEEFNVDIPPGISSHIAENIYRECLVEQQKGASTESITKDVLNAFVEFPWVNIEYDDLPEDLSASEKHIHEDGDITFDEVSQRYTGYYNNQSVSCRTNLEKMKDVMKLKYGITEFNIVGDDNEC